MDCVQNALGEIIPSNSFSVKRKFKSSTPSSPNRWWYVVRADKDVLTTLVTNWSTIASSNGWSIDYLHKFQDHDNIMNSCPPSCSSEDVPPTDSGIISPAVVPPTSPLPVPLAQTNLHPPSPAND